MHYKYYYRARYYDPGTARFLSEDPIGLNGGDSNFYRYSKNNPVLFNDPSGNFGALIRHNARAVCYGVDFTITLIATTPELISLSNQLEAYQEAINDIDYQMKNLEKAIKDQNCKIDKDHMRAAINDLKATRQATQAKKNLVDAQFGNTLAMTLGGGALASVCKVLGK